MIWAHYPFTVLIELVLMLLSYISYLLVIILIFASKAQKGFAIRLFLYQTVTQFIALSSQIIIPFAFYTDGNPVQDPNNQGFYFIPKIACQWQGAIVNSCWFAVALISCYMNIVIKRILDGKDYVQKKYEELSVICIIIIIVFGINVPLSLFANFQAFGFSWKGQYSEYTCNLRLIHKKNESPLQLAIFLISISIDIFLLVVGLLIIYYIKYKKIRNLEQMGFSMNYPILQLWIYPLVIVTLWNWDLIFKMLDAYRILYPDENSYLVFNIIWLIIQSFIHTEGIIVASLFLFSFRSQIIPTLPKWAKPLVNFLSKLSCFSFCFKQNKRIQNVNANEETYLYQDSGLEESFDNNSQAN